MLSGIEGQRIHSWVFLTAREPHRYLTQLGLLVMLRAYLSLHYNEFVRAVAKSDFHVYHGLLIGLY